MSDECKPFNFSCGEEMCAFPIQFCSIDLHANPLYVKCKYCNEDVCLSTSIPGLCQQFCRNMGLKPELLPNTNATYSTELFIFSVSLNFILVLCLLLLSVYIFRKKIRGWYKRNLWNTRNQQQLRCQNETHEHDPNREDETSLMIPDGHQPSTAGKAITDGHQPTIEGDGANGVQTVNLRGIKANPVNKETIEHQQGLGFRQLPKDNNTLIITSGH